MTDESIDVTPRRQPVQARSRERVESILRHAAAIFHEVGVDATSMSAIARQSDMSLASLYRYFPNKTAIVKAIAEDHVSRMESALRERLETLDLMDAVDVLIDQFYEFYRPSRRIPLSGVGWNPCRNYGNWISASCTAMPATWMPACRGSAPMCRMTGAGWPA